MNEAFFLSDDDRNILRDLIQDWRTRPRTRPFPAEQFTVAGTPDVYIAKLPSGGIPARTLADTLQIPGSAVCEVYKIDVTTPSTPTMTAVTSLTKTVFNEWPVPAYGSGTPYTKIERDKFGRWLCERPPYTRKATLTNTCSVNGTCTVNIYLNGSASGNTLVAHHNWMIGSTAIASGKEALVEYFEDEGRWVLIGAAC